MRVTGVVMAVCLLLEGGNVQGFEAVGRIRSVDHEKGVLHIHANGRDRSVTIAKDVRVLGLDGAFLEGGLRSKALGEGTAVTVSVGNGAAGPVIQVIRPGGGGSVAVASCDGRASTGLTPLSEMTAADRYKGPRGDLAEHGRKLQKDTLAVLRNAKARFPNFRIAYLGSRIYGGYATNALNPEPYAYEGAFAVRWLIRDQARGVPELHYDEATGAAQVPMLLWGPYLWGDGTAPRKDDGLVWERADLVGDGTHPSESGRRKVADMLLRFFTEDALASRWFSRRAGAGQPRACHPTSKPSVAQTLPSAVAEMEPTDRGWNTCLPAHWAFGERDEGI